MLQERKQVVRNTATNGIHHKHDRDHYGFWQFYCGNYDRAGYQEDSGQRIPRQGLVHRRPGRTEFTENRCLSGFHGGQHPVEFLPVFLQVVLFRYEQVIHVLTISSLTTAHHFSSPFQSHVSPVFSISS